MNSNLIIVLGILILFSIVNCLLIFYFLIIKANESPIKQEISQEINEDIMKNKNLIKTKEDKVINSTLDINPNKEPIYICNSEYQQIGTLYNEDNSHILPLFGKKINSNRWKYYTTTDGNIQLKLDIIYENRQCKDNIGCNELYDNEDVFVQQYNKIFKVSLYKYGEIEYDHRIL